MARFVSGLLVGLGVLFMATGGLCAAGMLYAGLVATNGELTVTTPDGATTTMPDSDGAGFYGLFSGLALAAIGVMVAWGGLVLFRYALANFRRDPGP